jgi:hypothetical protein
VACSNGNENNSDASASDATLETSSDAAFIDVASDAFTPGAHPAEPTLVNAGGPVLATPKVLPILLSNDPDAGELIKFFTELAASSAWAAQTSEYGVGKLTVLSPVTFSPTSSTINDQTLRGAIQASTYGATPAWGAGDPSTTYFFVFPSGTTIINQALKPSCTNFDGYHSEVASGNVAMPYAVAVACDGFYGKQVTALEQRTIAISRQLVNAVTNPKTVTKPAWFQSDLDDIIWSWVTGGEAGDMCLDFAPGFVTPSDMTHAIETGWSNAAAAAGGNPCVPANSAEPFFNAMPVLTDSVKLAGSFVTKGVQIPLHTSKTIPIELYSVGPTSGPWTITAIDYETLIDVPTLLTFSFDKTSGQNGDTVNLTITVNGSDDGLKGEAFLLLSTLGGHTNVSMGFIGN